MSSLTMLRLLSPSKSHLLNMISTADKDFPPNNTSTIYVRISSIYKHTVALAWMPSYQKVNFVTNSYITHRDFKRSTS